MYYLNIGLFVTKLSGYGSLSLVSRTVGLWTIKVLQRVYEESLDTDGEGLEGEGTINMS